MSDPRARRVLERLTRDRQTVSAAESLTGGLVAAALTSVAGASACFRGGVVAYDSDVKGQLLGVPDGVVAEHGVVSAACAEAMATGVRALLATTWAVATTGVAGPDRQEGKAVGTVYVAVSGAPSGPVVRRLALTGDRGAVQAAARDGALDLLVEVLDTTAEESLGHD